MGDARPPPGGRSAIAHELDLDVCEGLGGKKGGKGALPHTEALRRLPSAAAAPTAPSVVAAARGCCNVAVTPPVAVAAAAACGCGFWRELPPQKKQSTAVRRIRRSP